MTVTGMYSDVSTSACAAGNAISSTPTPSTSHVSLASQNGPMAAIIVSFSRSLASGSSKPMPRS